MRLLPTIALCIALASGVCGCASSRCRNQKLASPTSIPESAARIACNQEHASVAVPADKQSPHPPTIDPRRYDVRLVSNDSRQPEAELLPAPEQNSSDSSDANVLPLDLPTALRLADADNLTVALAREQIQQAYAESDQADSLWLPSLRGGVTWNRHQGPLLDTAGQVQDSNRGSLYAGGGASVSGAGTVGIPGLFASFHFADAMFQPLAARQRIGARENGAIATRNNVLLDVSLAYLELLRAAQDLAITEDLYKSVETITRLTTEFARTGRGLQADAERMKVELGLREIDVRRSKESMHVASARLAQMLRLEPCVLLQPADSAVVRLCIVADDCDCTELVALALSNRPELSQSRLLVEEAIQLMRRERFAPLVPSIVLGASYGGFGGGPGGAINDFRDRFDLDATAFWEVRSLGLGDAAARGIADSRMRQARIRELASLDLVAREVTEAHSQIQLRRPQIETAQNVLRFAKESFEHNVTRIRNGQGLPIEALQSAQALLQARREYLRALIDYNTAQYTLQRALGWPVGGPELAQ